MAAGFRLTPGKNFFDVSVCHLVENLMAPPLLPRQPIVVMPMYISRHCFLFLINFTSKTDRTRKTVARKWTTTWLPIIHHHLDDNRFLVGFIFPILHDIQMTKLKKQHKNCCRRRRFNHFPVFQIVTKSCTDLFHHYQARYLFRTFIYFSKKEKRGYIWRPRETSIIQGPAFYFYFFK